MTAAELTEWAAFERVYGPLLVHERVDIGFAHLAYRLSTLLGRSPRGRSLKVQDFLPAWYRPPRNHAQDAMELEAMLKGMANAND